MRRSIFSPVLSAPLAFALVAICLLAGALISRSTSVEGALAVSAIAAIVYAGVLHPPFIFFALTAVAMNLFGFVDLESELITNLKIVDVATLVLLTILLIRRGGLPRGITTSPAAVRLLVPVCILVGLTVLTVVASSRRWEQPLWLSLKGSKAFLYYSIALLGGLLRLSDRDIAAATRWILLASCIASAIIFVGFFIPLDDTLEGARVLRLSLGAGSIGYRTIIPACAFIFLALFVAFHGKEFLRAYERQTVLILTALATVCLALRSFWAGIGVALLLAVFTRRIGSLRARKRFAATTLALIAIGAVLYVTGGFAVFVERLTTVTSDTEARSGSVYARIEQVRSFRPLIEQYPLFGVGFLHTEGRSGASLVALTQTEEIGTIDVGFVDLVLKFGIVGAAVFLGALWLLYKRLGAHGANPLGEAARSYIICGVISLPGAALFSWQGGILPLSLVLLMISANASATGVAELASSVPRSPLEPDSTSLNLNRFVGSQS